MDTVFGIRNSKKKYKRAVVAIGVFDGLHVGHQRLIRDVVKRAAALRGTAVIMTFLPHPVQVLRPQDGLKLIVSLSHRLKLIEQAGVDVSIVIKFTKRFSRLSPETFIKQYLVNKVSALEIYVGDDFRFGCDRKGTLDYLRDGADKYGFHLNTIHVKKKGDKKIGSSSIRKLITQGKLSQASRLLARPVSVMGRVIRGDALGKTIGFPTINLKVQEVLLPPIGVYIANIIYNRKSYRGIAYIGNKPSVKKSSKIAVEAYVFRFKRNIYHKEVIVEFLKKIREEKFFSSLDDLKKQIQQDEKKARAFFARKR